MSIFVRENHEYVRDYDFLKNTVLEAAFFLSKSTGKSLEYCIKYIKSQTTGMGRFQIKDRAIKYLERTPENTDRERKESTFFRYISESVKERDMLSPSLTAYMNPDIKRSLLAIYIIKNMEYRSTFKNKMLEYELKGETENAAVQNILQDSTKRKNNSLSGAEESEGTVLSLKSGHPTLTSTCRAAASYGNANNEKLLAGNRHYFNPYVTITAISHIVRVADYPSLQKVMDSGLLVYPTAAEALECILYSTRLYWVDSKFESRISDYLSKLSGLELAAIVYIGDLYHCYKYSPAYVGSFIKKLATPTHEPFIGDPDSVISKADSSTLSTVSLMLIDITKGLTRKELKETNPIGYSILAANIVQLNKTIEENSTFLKAIMVQMVLPNSISSFPDSVRRIVPVSDTDSTLFSCQYWGLELTSSASWNVDCTRVAAIMTYLASKAVTHVLAMLSANLGSVGDSVHSLKMKNEFYYSVFVTTPMAKNYFASRVAREGAVYDKPKLELKGKFLRDSTLPSYVIDGAEEFMKEIMDRVVRDGKLSLKWVLRTIIDLEVSIIERIRNGGYTDMQSIVIKEGEAYKLGEEAPNFRHFHLWNSIFAPKYGEISYPPYEAVKVGVDITNQTKLKNWIAKIEDRELAVRLEEWFRENKIINISQLLLPLHILQNTGIPKEIIPVISARKLVYEILKPYYLILEALGLTLVDSDHSLLLSDWFQNISA